MTRRRDIGVVGAYARSNSWYAVHPNDYAKLRTAWEAGKAFCEVRDVQGDSLVLKLASIEAIQHMTPSGIEAAREETRLDNADDAVYGNSE